MLTHTATAGYNPMRKLGFIFAVFFTLAFPAIASAQLKMVPKDKLVSVNSPRLSKDSSVLDFDMRRIVAAPLTEDDAPVIYQFPFRNSGKGMLKIRSLRTTCTCVSASCDRMEVAPGEKAVISVRYDPKGHPGKFERKIFVYSQDGSDPSAVLALAVEVKSGQDLSREYPVQMGTIRLRRNSVKFSAGTKAVEKIRFVNLSGSPLDLRCEEMFLPGCIRFETRPEVVLSQSEGELVISYDPDGGESKKEIMLILKGTGVPPSQSVISIRIE